jgi:hypothetical protein
MTDDFELISRLGITLQIGFDRFGARLAESQKPTSPVLR